MRVEPAGLSRIKPQQFDPEQQMDTTITTASEISVPDSTKAPQSPSALEPSSPHCLPEEPVVVIAPNKSWSALNPRDLWAHRELLYFLIWRDLKVRYKQTFFGIAWVVMQPLLITLIFTIFLGMLARVPTGGSPYALVVFIGLLPWMFFSGAVSVCSNSLIANANLITKVYFPRVMVQRHHAVMDR